jgi:hypothetical protein
VNDEFEKMSKDAVTPVLRELCCSGICLKKLSKTAKTAAAITPSEREKSGKQKKSVASHLVTVLLRWALATSRNS